MSIIHRTEKPRAPQPRPPRKLPDGPKPVLPAFHLPVFRVRADDLEAYLFKVFRMEGFEFLLAAGVTQGECPEYVVRAVLPDACARQAIDIRSGRRTKNVPLILNVLCIDGYIPAGKYTIDTHPRPRPIDVYTSLVKSRLAARDLGCLQDPEIVAYKHARRSDKTFTAQSAAVDKVAEDVIAREREVLGK